MKLVGKVFGTGDLDCEFDYVELEELAAYKTVIDLIKGGWETPECSFFADASCTLLSNVKEMCNAVTWEEYGDLSLGFDESGCLVNTINSIQMDDSWDYAVNERYEIAEFERLVYGCVYQKVVIEGNPFILFGDKSEITPYSKPNKHKQREIPVQDYMAGTCGQALYSTRADDRRVRRAHKINRK